MHQRWLDFWTVSWAPPRELGDASQKCFQLLNKPIHGFLIYIESQPAAVLHGPRWESNCNLHDMGMIEHRVFVVPPSEPLDAYTSL